jgi:hypothetical protein
LPWLVRLWGKEIATLFVCLLLDFIEYLFPPLMAPVIGDPLDFAGTVLSVAFFGWIGFISLLELIPGIDAIPVFTITWLIWYIFKKRTDMKRIENELERWR